MFPLLADAVEELVVPVDGRAIAAAIALRDRVDAKIAEAVGHFDAESLWDLDAAVSMTAWLRSAAGMSRRDAGRLAMAAKRVRSLPATAAAWRSGELSSGQVNTIVGVVGERHLDRFAEHEAALVPTLAPLPVESVVRVMQAWRAKAEALDDEGDDAEPERSLHLSQTMGGRYELSGSLDAGTGDVVATALRLAATDDAEAEPARTPAERRADALGDVCRFFLDHQTIRPGGRHRPHLNVVVDLDALELGRSGHSIDGTALAGPAMSALLCDSALHRVVMQGRSTILDYGTATRTIPAPLWNAVVVRDEHCRFPGCDRPPVWCEGHHVTWVDDGGATCPANIVLVCSRHHHRLHRRGWEAKLRPDATFEVTAPDGRHWVTHPPGAAARLC
jgi:uncharacterized protein DUF222